MVSPASQAAARLRQQFPQTVRRFAQKQSLPLAAAVGTPTEQPGRHDPCIVENEQIAGLKQLRQIGEDAMRDDGAAAAQHEQTRMIALRRGMLSDEVRRQVVVEQVDVHDGPLSST